MKNRETNGATLGFEAKLWQAADKLRNNMDAAEIASCCYALPPDCYMGTVEVEDDGEPFEEKMKWLTEQLGEQFQESAKLENLIQNNLKELR